MNILVDGRTWSRYSAGIGTFFTSALLEWGKQCPQDIFYILLPKKLDPKVDISGKTSNIIILDYSSKFPNRLPNIIILQILVPLLCRKLHIDLYYSPVPHLPSLIPSRTRTLITIHDVVNIEMTHTMAWTNRMAVNYFFKQAVNNTDILWANSHYTKSKVEAYFPQRKSQKIFVGGAVDNQYFYPRQLSQVDKDTIRKKYGIKEKFILFVGSLEPRKNLKFLLGLMPSLYQQHHIQLVVVGANSWKSSGLRSIVESPDFPQKSTIFCGFITNEELAILYNTADCFVSAALMEGFGMPQIEALRCGCPVITAHNTAMIEVAENKDGAITIKGYDEKQWIEAIIQMITSKPHVNPQQLSHYNWEIVIKDLLNHISSEKRS